MIIVMWLYVQVPPQVDAKPVAQAAIVQMTDQPLDLSKPVNLKEHSHFTSSIGANGEKRNLTTPSQRCKYTRICALLFERVWKEEKRFDLQKK